MVTNVSQRKLGVITDGTPEKGRQYYAFSYTERALVVPTDTGTYNIPEHFCLILERVVLILE